MVELVGVDHGPDRLHHAVGDVEGEDVDNPALRVVGDRPGLAVDRRQLEACAQLRPPAGQSEHEPGDPLRALGRLGRRPGLPAAVADQDHVRSEQLEQGGQVAALGGGEEPAGDLVALLT